MTEQQRRRDMPTFPEGTTYWPYLESSERLNVVGAYVDLGWSVIPVHGDKTPALSEWGRYQTERPSLDDWQRWLDGKPSNGVTPIGEIAGIGVVCGEVSGNLVVLDFDTEETWAEFSKRHGELIEKARVVRTARGWHLYLVTKDGPCPSTRLNGIDVISGGKYAVLPPSLHPTGATYHDANPHWRLEEYTVENLQKALRPSGLKATRPIKAGEPAADFAHVIELLRPYWEKPGRHALSVPLAGLLAKKRWPWDLAEGLFNALLAATDDEEGRSRLADLRRTYERLEREDPVQAYTGLEKILPPDDLAQLTRAVAQVRRDAFHMEAELARIKELAGAEQDRAMVNLVYWAATNLPQREVELLGTRMRRELKYPDGKFQRIVKAAREEQIRQVEEAADRRTEITEQHREKALKVLGRLNLLWQMTAACTAYGVAGERKNVCLLYLALTSRLLDHPISVTIRGESSAGKSHVLGQVLWLFPKEAYWELTGMSQQALIYTEQSFAHRTIIIMERPGMGNADYNIRTLQSEGRIAFETVTKGPDGTLRPMTIEKEGPTNFVSTTIEAVGDVQNENRHWTLMADETAEQTARVLKMQGKQLEGGVPTRSEARAIKVAQAMQYLLKPKRVVMPYGQWLADRMPREPLRIRRDFARLGAAIQAMALLHQYQRDEDGKGRLVATVADYAMVRTLLGDTFVSSLQNMNPKTLELVDVAKEIYEEENCREGRALTPQHVTINEIQRRTGKASNTITNWLKPAIEAGYLQDVGGGGRGKAWKLVPGDPKRIQESILPTVGDLAGAFPELVRPWVDPLTGEEHQPERDQTD